MNSKKIMLTAAAIIAAISVSAKEGTGSAQGHGWYAGVDAGTQIFFGRNDKYMNLGDRLAPAVDLFFGGQITDVIGLDLTFSNSKFIGVCHPRCTDPNFLTSERYTVSDQDEVWIRQDGYYMNLYLRVMVNLINWFGGVDPERHSNLNLYAGGGWINGYGCDCGAVSPSINGGLVYGYSINSGWTIDVTARGALVGNYFDGEHCDEHTFHGLAGLMVGFRYNFGK